MLSKLFKFFKKRFWALLVIIVLISYGQMLGMQPWEDDNALFFKLAHIAGPAGFLGKGILGEIPYKYTATLYYPIYLLVGHNPLYYFLLGTILYLISVFAVGKMAKEFLSAKYAKISMFLYAAGYIASDGYIRLFNTVITSLSVIFVSFLFYFYHRYLMKGRIKFYLLSVFFYLLAVEFGYVRTHYLIAPVVFFEVIFFLWGKRDVWWKAVLRLLPFSVIFYKYFVQNSDPRVSEVSSFGSEILNGNFSVLYGFLASFTNLILPDWFTGKLNLIHDFIFNAIGINSRIYLFFAFIFVLFLVTKKKILVTASVLVWYFLAKKIFLVPVVDPNYYQFGLAFLGGGLLIILITNSLVLGREFKKKYLFWIAFMTTSLIGYSFYRPLVIYDSINRYLAHSFMGITLFLPTMLAVSKKTNRRLLTIIIIIWGIGNLLSGFLYQREILTQRTAPVRDFYDDLQRKLPKIDKGDLLFFNVAQDSRQQFLDAITAAQMPNETAVAWRYGLDRYDFRLIDNCQKFLEVVQKEDIDSKKIWTFEYSKGGGVELLDFRKAEDHCVRMTDNE